MDNINNVYSTVNLNSLSVHIHIIPTFNKNNNKNNNMCVGTFKDLILHESIPVKMHNKHLVMINEKSEKIINQKICDYFNITDSEKENNSYYIEMLNTLSLLSVKNMYSSIVKFYIHNEYIYNRVSRRIKLENILARS